MQTHMVVNPDGAASIQQINRAGDDGVFVRVPDIDGAQQAQRGSIGPAGDYDINTNSCATHCADVVNAGGGNMPSTTRGVVKHLEEIKRDQ